MAFSFEKKIETSFRASKMASEGGRGGGSLATDFGPREEHAAGQFLEDVRAPLAGRLAAIGQRPAGRPEEGQIQFHPRRPLAAVAPVDEVGALQQERRPGHHLR